MLAAEFPELRETVRNDLAEIVATGTASDISVYLKRLSRSERLLEKQCHGMRGDKKIVAAYIRQSVLTRMAYLATKQHLVSEATGIEKGKVCFNLLNGFVAQKLLFSRDLERKPVSLFWFRLFWPVLWQKRFLMPLVQTEGIYCFYSRQLISKLTAVIDKRSCLEIAAGDGTLTRFLADSGVQITATDDYSWQHEVKYTASVEKIDARGALRKYAPEVVICSWPPAGNSFEQQVFRTRSVQQYIVICSRHRFAAGNWNAYQEQSLFDYKEDSKLSSLVLPPELDAAVYVFKRKD